MTDWEKRAGMVAYGTVRIWTMVLEGCSDERGEIWLDEAAF